MPGPLVVPLIAAGAQLAGGAINAGSQGNMNRKNRKFSEHMYDRQKQDNLDFWNLQNTYNSPQAQMQRFQEAGLNPNLIYGQGNSGNAGSVQTPDFHQPDTRAPEWGNALGNAGAAGIDAFYDTQIKQATADNLKRQGTVLDEEAALKAAQTRATEATTNRSIFDLGLETDLRGNSLDFRRAALEQLKQSIDINLRRDTREAMQNASNLREAAERVLSMRTGRSLSRAQAAEIRSRINNLEKDGTLKDLEIALKRNNASWSDPLWQRFGASLLGRIFGDSTTMNPLQPLQSLPPEMKGFPGPKY